MPVCLLCRPVSFRLAAARSNVTCPESGLIRTNLSRESFVGGMDLPPLRRFKARAPGADVDL